MKQCPACQRELDDHLSFCPFDGASLVGARGECGYAGVVLDDKYRLDEKVGEGGTGEVYRATHIHMDATVAVKILHRSLASDQIALERFRREARAAAQIRHANAVAVTDFGVTKDTGMAYLVMEFLEGQDLRDRINQQVQLGYEEIYQILDQTCAAVHAAHGKGIIHRDLKPDNIWLLKSEDGIEHVKVLDFGIAKLKSYGAGNANLTEKGLIIGTPNYMSPEQCRGEHLDPRSDVYSLGVIVYEMLTGDAPFQADTPVAIVLRHASERPRPPHHLRADLPNEIEEVVLRALEKVRENRQGSAIQLANEFQRALYASGVDLRNPRKKTPQATSVQTSPGLAGTNATNTYDAGSSTLITPQPDTSEPIHRQPRQSYETQVAELPRSYETQVAMPSLPAEPELRAARGYGGSRNTEPAPFVPTEAPTRLLPDTSVPSTRQNRPKWLFALIAVVVVIGLGVTALLIGNRDETGGATATAVSGAGATAPLPGMVLITQGEFTMGSNNSEELSEKPEHMVKVGSFYIDRNEVTNENYYEFVKITKHPAPQDWIDGKFRPGEDKYPVVYVSWFDAESYARWLGKRLPTESEWEYAARGDDKRLYPWGGSLFSPENANSKETEKNHPMPVGSYPSGASRFGLLDMAGNVAEWTASDYTLYPGSKAKMEPGNKIIRGGSFFFDASQAMVTTRWSVPPGTVKEYIGFRCAKDTQ